MTRRTPEEVGSTLQSVRRRRAERQAMATTSRDDGTVAQSTDLQEGVIIPIPTLGEEHSLDLDVPTEHNLIIQLRERFKIDAKGDRVGAAKDPHFVSFFDMVDALGKEIAWEDALTAFHEEGDDFASRSRIAITQHALQISRQHLMDKSLDPLYDVCRMSLEEHILFPLTNDLGGLRAAYAQLEPLSKEVLGLITG